MRPVGLIVSLQPNNVLNLFIALPTITEGWKQFCFRETKNADFGEFLTGE